jgi:hypothetical protein
LKRVASIFLILIISSQWFLGLLTIDLVEEIWVEQKISEHKLNLSIKVSDELGVSDDINFEEINPSQYLRLGYGAPFVVAHEVNGEKRHFKVNQNELAIDFLEKEIKLSDFTPENSKKVGFIFTHLLLSYIDNPFDFKLNPNFDIDILNPKPFNKIILNPVKDIPTPPPQFFI